MTTTKSPTIDIDIEGVAAAYTSNLVAATGHVQDLTVIWSIRPHECRGGQAGCITRTWDAETMPMVWDPNGMGRFTIGSGSQCGCGARVEPVAEVYSGHLHGAALAGTAKAIARRFQARIDDAAADVRADLRAALAEAIRDRAAIRTDEDREDFDNEHPYVDLMCEPGVGVEGDGTLVAWDWEPGSDGEIIEVAEGEL